ncbi:MAG: pitrilysin family protein [Smithellaceae bacterium]|nr:pitrilysin family protein [Smithellaceae bacterium]
MYHKTVLDNGVKIVSEKITHARSVSIGAWVPCGSRHEDASKGGIAHFIEHMLFKGTETRSAFDIALAIDSVGGVMNAFTGKELTAFYIKIPDYHLALAINLLADIMVNSRFDGEEIKKEESVILQEISMLEDSPDDYIHDFFEATFWDGHSLGRPILGTKETVEGIDRKALVDFFQTCYLRGDLLITAAGNLEHGRLVEMVRDAFASHVKGSRKNTNTSPVVTSEVAVLEKELGQVHMVIGTTAPSVSAPDRYTSFVLNTVLGGSTSSRLFQEIREQRGLAYAIHSYLSPYEDAGMMGIYFGAAEDKVQDVMGLIFAEMGNLCREPITGKELYTAKELLKGNFLLSLESTDNRMTRLAKNELCFGHPISVDEVISSIDRVTAEEVMNMAREMFNPGIVSIAAIGRVCGEDLVVDILRA